MPHRRILTLFLSIPLVAASAYFWFTHEFFLSHERPDKVSSQNDAVKMVNEETVLPYRIDNAVDPSMADYVGSVACRDCHSEIWEKYQSHPMANSFALVEHATPIEDYEERLEFHPPGNRSYRVERTDRGVFHHESMLDSSGNAIYDQAVPVTWSLGSGKRGRAYVIDHDGLLFKSSISWYSDTHAWGLSPDYLPESHMRFERRMTGGCLACHSGLANFTRGEPDRFKKPPFLEEAISCERCHGPGRRHVALQHSGGTGQDSIVNPSQLDMDRREAVCAQCHLRGQTRILRTGRTAHDFRPGERLEDNWIVFVKSHGGGLTKSGRAATQAEQMVSSVCFQRSEGRLGCTSCHDPHSMPALAERDVFYRGKCLNCHMDQGCSLPVSERETVPYMNRCTSCHMPSINAANVLHRSVADHRILRKPLEDDDAEASESIVFQFAATPIPEFELRRARALKMAQDAIESQQDQNLAKAAATLLKQLVKGAPEDLDLYVAMGNCALIQNQPREAERYWTEVLRINPRHEQTIEALAVLYQDNMQLIPAEHALKQFVALNPWHGSYYGRLAGVSLYQGKTDEAIAAAERGLELNPNLWKLHEFLVDVYTNIGDQESAERHQNLLKRMRAADPANQSGNQR